MRVRTGIQGLSLMVLLAGLSLAPQASQASMSSQSPAQAQMGSVPVISPFKLSYFTSAEARYDKIELAAGKLTVTRFDDAAHKCAQWVQQAPCWNAQDLRQRVILPSQTQLAALQHEIAAAGFFNLQPVYGKAGTHQRYYPITLNIQLGGRQKQVVYQSFPGGEPMPLAFKRVRDKLFALTGRVE